MHRSIPPPPPASDLPTASLSIPNRKADDLRTDPGPLLQCGDTPPTVSRKPAGRCYIRSQSRSSHAPRLTSIAEALQAI